MKVPSRDRRSPMDPPTDVPPLTLRQVFVAVACITLALLILAAVLVSYTGGWS